MKMTHRPQLPERDFIDLVERVLNHEASLDDIAHLNAVLPQDPSALRYFVEMRMLHDSLEDRMGAASRELDSIEGRLIEFPVRPRAHAVVGSIPAKTGWTWRRWAAAAVVLLAAGGAFWGGYRLLHPPAFEVVARNGTGFSAVPPQGEWIREGQRLKLTHGAVELRSADGNSLTFEGPGELTVHNRERLILGSGLLWAELEGGPLRIRVPRGEITDLGTTFGIDQSSGTSTRIDVFDGGVRFSDSADTTHSVEAKKGESLISSGSDWTPERGKADAARYTSGIRRPLGFSFAADDSEAARIRSSLAFGARWTTVTTPAGAAEMHNSPVHVAWAGSHLFSTGASGSPEAAVLHTHHCGFPWQKDFHTRSGEARALGLPDSGGGIVLRFSNLASWLDQIGARGYRVMLYRNTGPGEDFDWTPVAESSWFQPVSAYSEDPSPATLLGKMTCQPEDHRPADFPDGTGGKGYRAAHGSEETFAVDVLTLTVPVLEHPARSNIAAVVLHPVF